MVFLSNNPRGEAVSYRYFRKLLKGLLRKSGIKGGLTLHAPKFMPNIACKSLHQVEA